MNFLTLALLSILSLPLTMAHEGHNHDAPKTLSPLKGGIIKTFSVTTNDGKADQHCFVEVVKSGINLKIYFFDNAKKNVAAKDFQLKAGALPYSRKVKNEDTKSIPLTLEDKKTFYLTSFDKQNAHKFDLILKFTGPDYCSTNEEIFFIID